MHLIKHRHFLLLIFLMAILAIIISCGGGGGGSTSNDDDNPTETANLEGYWDVFLTFNQVEAEPKGLTINQIGDGIDVYLSCDPISFSGFGQVIDSTFSFSAIICGENSNFTGTVSNDTITGTFQVGQAKSTWRALKVSQPNCPVFNVPNANITIDGDFSDWNVVTPIIQDWIGDGNQIKGSDLQDIYVAADNSNIYIRIDLSNGPPENNLYYGISFYSQTFSEAGDRFIFINMPIQSCTIDRMIDDCGGKHEVLALGTISIAGDSIEASVPRGMLNPPLDSFVNVWVDTDGPSIDGTETVKVLF